MTEEVMSVATSVAPAPHRSPTPELHATYTTLEIVVALVAVVGNSMVIHVFRQDRRLRRRTNYYIVSLAVADLLVGLLGIPFAILASVGLPRNLHACLFTVSLLVMLCTISIFCLVAVSVDRYWAILHPMCYSRNVRTKTAVVTVYAKISGGPRGRFSKNVTRKSPNHHVSAHHAHYSYHPPSEINFLCHHCSHFVSYPVYHGLPPTYVYKYREHGGRFGDLLTGLALYNLGRAAIDHWEYTHYYSLRPDEKCSLQVIGHKRFEETRFPCFIMSTFMHRSPESHIPDPSSLDITSSRIDIRPFVNNTGPVIKITRDQDCVIWHNTTTMTEKNRVPCALLKEYAETMKPSGVPVYVWLPITLAVVVAISAFCQCCCKKKKTVKEEVPFNRSPFTGYCSQY